MIEHAGRVVWCTCRGFVYIHTDNCGELGVALVIAPSWAAHARLAHNSCPLALTLQFDRAHEEPCHKFALYRRLIWPFMSAKQYIYVSAIQIECLPFLHTCVSNRLRRAVFCMRAHVHYLLSES